MACETPLRHWRNRSVLGIGEAMLEFATVGGDLYRRGFAGDTLNTCWHMAQILGPHAQVAYFTRVGVDTFSEQLVRFIGSSRMDTRTVTRDPQRSLGLYVISLDGVERQFNYWRESSAARCLADDPATLADATKGRALIHVSGITLAVIGARGRSNLMDALGQARSAGTLVSFDPNVRNRLWPDRSELRLAMQAILELVDIALPSFDDEAELWGDADPDATLTRLERAGVTEIVVKNGARDVSFSAAGRRGLAPTPAVTNILDTTGAGDGFNAGYLAARLAGMNPLASCGVGQAVAGQVLAHHGALAPTDALAAVRDSIDAYASRSPLGR